MPLWPCCPVALLHPGGPCGSVPEQRLPVARGVGYLILVFVSALLSLSSSSRTSQKIRPGGKGRERTTVAFRRSRAGGVFGPQSRFHAADWRSLGGERGLLGRRR